MQGWWWVFRIGCDVGVRKEERKLLDMNFRLDVRCWLSNFHLFCVVVAACGVCYVALGSVSCFSLVVALQGM